MGRSIQSFQSYTLKHVLTQGFTQHKTLTFKGKGLIFKDYLYGILPLWTAGSGLTEKN